MADEDYQDRTEQPTPKRRAEAREKGQIARSRDLNASLVLLTGILLLSWWGPWMGYRSAAMLRDCLTGLRPGLLTVQTAPALLVKFASLAAALLAPVFLGLVFISVLANYVQGGWIFSTQRLTPELSRINPWAGLKRMVSGEAWVELGKSLAKVTLIAVVAYFSLRRQLPHLLPLLRQGLGQLFIFLKAGALHIAGRIAMALLVLGLLDYLYQRYRYEKSLRMTKQEVKDELRQTETGHQAHADGSARRGCGGHQPHPGGSGPEI